MEDAGFVGLTAERWGLMMRLLMTICLLLAFAFWMAEKRWRKWVGLPVEDNCATWAAEHFDYLGGDGVMLHRTVSESWLKFPHVVIVQGARQAVRREITLTEYVPRVRLADVGWPPRKFDGVVRRTRFVAD